MHIDKSNASSHQRAILDERERFSIRCVHQRAEMAKQIEYLGSVPQIAARNLADDKGMHADQLRVQRIGEPRIPEA